MLDLAYDQIVHPQKNLTLRVLLDAVMGRLVELKYEMIELEKSEYHFMDDVIADMELTPYDVEITGKFCRILELQLRPDNCPLKIAIIMACTKNKACLAEFYCKSYLSVRKLLRIFRDKAYSWSRPLLHQYF